MTTFFTADLHFDHKNIIKHCKRPFSTLEEMNAALIREWNEVVGEKDKVWVLGDFMWKESVGRIHQILGQLNGSISLIKGNHDRHSSALRSHHKIAEIKDFGHELKIQDEETGEKRLIVLCHYPMLVWNRAHYGSWMLHGHCHGTFRNDNNTSRHDVGVDTNNYRPYSYEDIKAIMAKKSFKPVSHHEKRK